MQEFACASFAKGTPGWACSACTLHFWPHALWGHFGFASKQASDQPTRGAARRLDIQRHKQRPTTQNSYARRLACGVRASYAWSLHPDSGRVTLATFANARIQTSSTGGTRPNLEDERNRRGDQSN